MVEENAVTKKEGEAPANHAAPESAAPEQGSGDWAVLGDHAQHPPASDLNASTMLIPAPEFPAAYRTPNALLSAAEPAQAAKPVPETPSDPNAKTMILPPMDFSSLPKEPELLPRPKIPEINLAASTMIIPASEMAFSPEVRKEFNRTEPAPDAPIALKPDVAPAKLAETLIPAAPVVPKIRDSAKTTSPTILAISPAAVKLDSPNEAPKIASPATPKVDIFAAPKAAEPVAKMIEVPIAPQIENPVAPEKIMVPVEAHIETPIAPKIEAFPVAMIATEPPPLVPTSTAASEKEAPKRPATVMLAPPPDNPFGSADSSYSDIAVANLNQTFQAPAPSGVNWRTVMNAIPAEQPKAVLVASGLVKWFGKRQVVRGVDLEVGAGEIIGLLGRNGAGKTTTFRMIMGLLHPDGGHVTYENRDVTRLPMYQRANRGIGYLAQNPSIFQRMSVEENLLAVLELQEPSRKVRKDRMEELIQSLGLEKVRKSQAAVLSGGERRRLEIARAMSLRPRIVLFDEPFAGIDPITVSEIQSILRELKKQGVGVLITDHNVRETLTITDRTYIMDDGKIWIHGHPKDIVENEEARARYLGQDFRLDF